MLGWYRLVEVVVLVGVLGRGIGGGKDGGSEWKW